MINAINLTQNKNLFPSFKKNNQKYIETLRVHDELNKKVEDIDDFSFALFLLSLPFIYPLIKKIDSEKMSKGEKFGAGLLVMSFITMVTVSIKKFKLFNNGEYKGGKNDPQNNSTK